MGETLNTVLAGIGITAFVALSAYLLLLTGVVSFGQQAFFGIGAYAAGIATAVWGWPLPAGLAAGAAAGAAAQACLGFPLLRLRGLHFSVATLALAEMARIGLGWFSYRVDRAGETVGPDGIAGFGGIRAVLENGIGAEGYLVLVWTLLGLMLAAFMLLERTRAGVMLRMIGRDETTAALVGVDVAGMRLAAAAAAGAIAGLGGGLYAHHATYIEPGLFNLMLGVHSLAYGLIGGLGTALGPLLGVAIDVGILEVSGLFRGYRMVVFGLAVVLLLIYRPRGLLDEITVHRWWNNLRTTVTAAKPAQYFDTGAAVQTNPGGKPDDRQCKKPYP